MVGQRSATRSSTEASDTVSPAILAKRLSRKEPLPQLLAAAGSITKVGGVSMSENRIGASSQEM
jgi:hypothetical protein